MVGIIDAFITKTNLWVVISISAFLVSLSTGPKSNINSFLAIIISTSVVLSLILRKVSCIENLWKLLFLKQLADIELYKRKCTANPSFFDLEKDTKEEIDKLDLHIQELFTEYIEILVLIPTGILIIFLMMYGIIPLITLNASIFEINNLILIVAVQILNILFLYDTHIQLTKDFSLYKHIYKIYKVGV